MQNIDEKQSEELKSRVDSLNVINNIGIIQPPKTASNNWITAKPTTLNYMSHKSLPVK